MEDKINAVLSKVFDLGADVVAKNMQRSEVPKWDSLTHMDLVCSLEIEFGIRLDIDDIIAMGSFNDIRQIVTRLGRR